MLLLIAATMTVAGLLTSSANAAGAVYDKAIVDESLDNMQQTVSQLQDKAESETDSIKKQEMILKAQSLNETEQKLRDLGEKFYKNDLKAEAAGLSRSLIVPIKGGTKEIMDSVSAALTVADTSVQTINSIANSDSGVNPADARSDLWSKVADTNDECEIQIMIAKARQLTKEAEAARKDATAMADYYRAEKNDKITSREVEDKLVEVVEESPVLQEEIGKSIWDYLDEVDDSTFANRVFEDNSSQQESNDSLNVPETSSASIPNSSDENSQVEDNSDSNITKTTSSNSYTKKEVEDIIANAFLKVYPDYKKVFFADSTTQILMNAQGNGSCHWSGVAECNNEGIYFNVILFNTDIWTREDFDKQSNDEKINAVWEYENEREFNTLDMRHKSSKYNATYYGDDYGTDDEIWYSNIKYYCYPYYISFEGYSNDKNGVVEKSNVLRSVFNVLGECK